MFSQTPPSPARETHLIFFNEKHFRKNLESASDPKEVFKDAIAGANTQWENRFREGENVRQLVAERSHFTDCMLRHAWKLYEWDEKISLIAVGGYGRGELHPNSDIDLLFLTRRRKATVYRKSIEQFLAFLWDIQFEIGQSVRTVSECVAEAKADITISTNLLDTRTVVGDENLRRKLNYRTRPEKIWPADKFFQAKFQEQEERHAKHGINEYDMEPNVKESPGGLRDIQTINWVTKRYFGVSGLDALANRGVYTEEEYNSLRSGEYSLWRIRYGLHLLTGRSQDQLLFDHQRQLASMFGYEDTKERLGVEAFMQRYYCVVMSLREINDVLMQYMRELVSASKKKPKIVSLNERFRLRDGYLEATSPTLFKDQPSSMIEIFSLLAKDSKIAGLHAATIRQLREYGHLVNEEFRDKDEHKALFIEMLSCDENLSIALQKMSRYAILGRYLLEFGAIIGQPQHDLFHRYPVDVHTLHVIRNICDFRLPEQRLQFPLSCHIYSHLRKPVLLVIAGLYHDIGKGRGGDHSELGAVDAYDFAINHGFTEREAKLIAWLVESHLLMSRISQREDISNPEVISNFARHVEAQEQLDLLYSLTVADIRATNPELWTSWRASLLRQLYHETSSALRRGLENPKYQNDVIEETRQAALKLLESTKTDKTEVLELWDSIDGEYFQREFPEDIAWHTEELLHHKQHQRPLIAVKTFVSNNRPRATELLISTQNSSNVFAAVANAIDQLSLSIQDARLYTADESTLDIFYLLDGEGAPLNTSSFMTKKLKRVVREELSHVQDYRNVIQRRTPRVLKQFPVQTRTIFSQQDGVSVLEVITADRAGLLATIGRIFAQYNIRINTARISTLGERVEDLFTIADADGNPIVDERLAEELQRSIRETIDQKVVAPEY